MKRSLLVAGLVLTIATSIVSGTLAAYNTQVELDADTVVAKNFVLTAAKTTSTLSGIDQKIAPGEKKEIKFSVSNEDVTGVTETNMDVVIAVDVTVNGEDISPLTYKLYDGDRYVSGVATNTLLGEGTTTVKSFKYEGLKFDAGEAKTKNYVLIIDWPWNGSDDTSNQGNDHSNSVQITVSGQQSK